MIQYYIPMVTIDEVFWAIDLFWLGILSCIQLLNLFPHQQSKSASALKKIKVG